MLVKGIQYYNIRVWTVVNNLPKINKIGQFILVITSFCHGISEVVLYCLCTNCKEASNFENILPLFSSFVP